jgi:ATP-dependent helicase/nuclease subunit B
MPEKSAMQARFLLGPAGSGKTHRCLAEVRAALAESPEGPPLLFLAPKQATFQLERQILAGPRLAGYTRLQILSFDRLAEFILEELSLAPPQLLRDEGRVMVLRALLAAKRGELQIFHASARLPGFAQELGVLLRELQRHRLMPDRLARLATELAGTPELGRKMRDLGILLHAYQDWLRAQHLEDAGSLLDLATSALRGKNGPSQPQLGALWLDGFAEMTPQELELLAAVLPFADRATLAFCLEEPPHEDPRWLSTWAVVGRTFRACHGRVTALPQCQVTVETLNRDPQQGRFAGSPALRHLEQSWTVRRDPPALPQTDVSKAVRLVRCANPEAEAAFAAREIVRFVRDEKARFRDVAVLVRSLEPYHHALRRALARHEIPFFLDRREPVAHHPLAELTRYALRTVAFGWRSEDWFSALKSGLVPAGELEIDALENAALEHGWEGKAWHEPLVTPEDSARENRFEGLRQELMPPFTRLEAALAGPVSGAQLAGALRAFCGALKAGDQLASWTADGADAAEGALPRPVHQTVWEQVQQWLEDLAMGFPTETLPLRKWLPILEAGLGGLTVGVIPPALDQVLVGAIDRSRNPDLKLVLVLGLNEGIFPAPPPDPLLLTADERATLEEKGVALGASARLRIGHERYYGYIACTRAAQRLVLTCSACDSGDRLLNPSPLLAHVAQMFPGLKLEEELPAEHWTDHQHAAELLTPLARTAQAGQDSPALGQLRSLPGVAPLLDRLEPLRNPDPREPLSSKVAGRLYGPELKTSVTSLEKFAECPFRFFAAAGMRADERKLFEFGTKERGDFQHQVLKKFHDQLQADKQRWHELTPSEARRRITEIAGGLAREFNHGLLLASGREAFLTRQLIASLGDFIEVIVGWMPQYEFEPAAAELKFSEQDDADIPPWRLELGDGKSLVLRGSMDRVDLLPRDAESAWCVVLDYKSSAKKIDALLLKNGVQLQLPAYLAVLRQLADARERFAVKRLVPAGVFYVSLRGEYKTATSRAESSANRDEARRLAYRHSGRFDAALLDHFDKRPVPPGEELAGDQFNFRITKKGELHGSCKEPMPTSDFVGMLEDIETHLRATGERIFRGEAAVDPYRRGAKKPCDYCPFKPVCRIDPWTHTYRALSAPAKPAKETE